ncbi:MAG: hypothetical protein KDB56_02490 [Mycobacterium sp.]|nr:hypothetical protein [Mycobacterium sp.]
MSDASAEPSSPEPEGADVDDDEPEDDELEDDDDDEPEDEDDDVDDPVDPGEPEVSANAMAGIDAIAAPTPNATARAPTRPT